MDLSELKRTRVSLWDEILQSSSLINFIQKERYDFVLYAIYLIETYHYTKHNAKNQALVGCRKDNWDVHYMRYCFEHATEETGHELMALHDLRSLGVSVEENALPTPLDSTRDLVEYLYDVSTTGNPVQRLGYSFWAESSYEFINPILEKLRATLGLKTQQMTFFINHAQIDDKHAKDVEDIICKTAVIPQDWKDIENVMRGSLFKTVGMMDEVYAEYLAFQENASKSRYSFLKNYL